MGVKIHDRLLLIIEDGSIVLAPYYGELALVIDRITFKIDLQGIYLFIYLSLLFIYFISFYYLFFLYLFIYYLYWCHFIYIVILYIINI